MRLVQRRYSWKRPAAEFRAVPAIAVDLGDDLHALDVIDRPALRVRRARPGFTLVELLVAVGVVIALVGLTLPTLAKVRRHSQLVACTSNLRSFGAGMTAYATQWNGVLPWEGYAEGDRAERHLGPWDEPSTWINACPKYVDQKPYGQQIAEDDAGTTPLPKAGDRSMFICPAASDAAAGPQDDVVVDGYFMMWGLDKSGQPSRRKTYFTYAYNTQLDRGVEDRNVTFRVTVNLRQCRSPSTMILMVEKIVRPDEFDPPFASSVAQQECSWREFTTRHGGGGNFLFVDGHVGYATRREVLAAPGAPYNYNQVGKLIWDPRAVE